MRNNGNTTPVSIVDKNGKQTTVHRRSERPATSRFSMNLQPVLAVNQQRSDQEIAIKDAARTVNDESGFARIAEIALSNSLKDSSDIEVELIAGAIDHTGFKEMLVHAVVSPDETATIAAVYDPHIVFTDQGTNARIAEYSRTINKAHIYMRGPIGALWPLYDEPDHVRAKVKRFVAVYMAVNMGGMKMPSTDLTHLALNADEKEYDIILQVLRSNQNATLEQIDFVINGGPSAISAGAL